MLADEEDELSSEVYLNGEFVPYAEARIPVEDRGFTFADGIYEVVRVVGGRAFRLDGHLDRLERSAGALEIPLPAPRLELSAAMMETASRNAVKEGTIYLQLTRGVAPRKHGFPEVTRPTLVILARPFGGHPAERYREGVTAVTEPDRRWGLCEVKTIGLLPNVLAYERARRAGAFEAILVRGDVVTEGSHTSLFGVLDGVVRTHPIDNILPGVTRSLVIERLRGAGLDVREEAMSRDELQRADEVFLTGTTTEVLPVVRIDGAAVGSGRPGAVAGQALELYRTELRATRSGEASSSR